MRTIKFRAWDGKRMTTSGIMFNTSTGCVEVPKDASFGGTITIPYSLMQFTGLHDKNGKEIYEGDVVVSKYQKKAIVEWSNEHACFCTRTIDEFVKDEFQYCISDIIEVIGNIYENPELK